MQHNIDCKTSEKAKKKKHLEVGKLCDSWPEFLVGSSQYPEDPEELVDLRITLRDDWQSAK